MGCIQTESVSVSTDMLKTQLRRLKYSLDIQKQRIQKDRLKGDEFLYAEFVKPAKQRSKKLERAMIIGNARFVNQKNIYSFLENETSILLQHGNFIDNQKQLKNISSSLNILLYCYTFMSCEQLVKFSSMFKQVYPEYPQPSETEISNQVMKHEKAQLVAFSQEIEYLLQFSSNYSISMEKINQVGHNYRYGASEYQG